MSANKNRRSAQGQAPSRSRLLKAIIRGDFPLKDVEGRLSSAAYGHSSIPPDVYQTWISNKLGGTHLKQIAKFRDLNKELSFHFYDNNGIDQYMEAVWSRHQIFEVYKNALYGPLKTDIFRYCILLERGGFYFDINKGLSVPICSLIRPDAEALITYEISECYIPPDLVNFDRMAMPNKIVSQWGFGFTAGHPVLSKLISNICEYYPVFKGRNFAAPKHAIVMFTGPGMFTKTVRDYFAAHDDEKVVQTGLQFNGAGIVNMKGSYVRYFTVPSYATSRNDAIVS